MRLAVAIVCKNNADTIGRTLDSIRGLADEIVAVDSGSTDGTLSILDAAGARIIHSPWLGHVRTKQLALDACHADWVLCLDSDESLSPALRQRLPSLLDDDLPRQRRSGASFIRLTHYAGTPLLHAWQPEWRLRLVRRGAARWVGLDPHDKLELTPPAQPLAVAPSRPIADGLFIRHDSIATFADFFAKQAQHARTMATSLHAAGVTPSYLRLLSSPIGAFLKQLVLKSAWRDGWPGWLAATSTAVGAATKHAILFELWKGHPPSDSGVATTPNRR